MSISEGVIRRFLLCFCCVFLAWMATGCSSSSKSTQPAGIQFTSPSSSPSIDWGESITLTVNQQANWSLQSGCVKGNPVGSFGGAPTATGTTVTYNAPQTGATCSQDVVVATASNQSVTNQSAVLTILLAAPPTFSNTAFTTPCPASGSIIAPPSPNPTTGVTGGTVAQVGVPAVIEIPPTQNTLGGVPPYTWQLASNSAPLPPGLSLIGTGTTNTSQIEIAGTPQTSGCSTVTLQVSDSTASATGNCSPPACFEAPITFWTIPAPLKVQVPAYVSATNDPNNNGVGAPYPPAAMVASGGQPPYFWCNNLSSSQTLSLAFSPWGIDTNHSPPPGLTLDANPSLDCTSPPPNSGVAVLYGTPSNNNETVTGPGCSDSNASIGCFPANFLVYDSQIPYPATSASYSVNPATQAVKPTNAASLSGMQDLPLQPCSLANQAPFLISSSSTTSALNPDAFLTGPVAFMLRGFDANGPVAMAGSVTLAVSADGKTGVVTGGSVDVTRSTGHQQLTIQAGSGSWYVLGDATFGVGAYTQQAPNVLDYSRGCMNLSFSNSGVQPIQLAFTLSGCSNHFTQFQVTSTSLQACGLDTNNNPLGQFTAGRIIEFDDNNGSGTRASGILRLQNSTSFAGGLSGPYAFGLTGFDATNQHYAIAGSFQGGSGTLSAVAADIDDGGTLSSQLTGGSGTFSTPDTNGRITGSFSAGSASLDLAGYVVGQNEVLLATTDSLAPGHPIASGEAITTASSFSNASLQNSHIFHIGGLSGVGTDVSVGALNFDGVSALSGTVYQDQAATLGTTSVSAVYQIDPGTGRTTFNTTQQGQTLGAHPFVAYVIPPPANLARSNCSTPAACVTGFLVGTDSTAQSGLMEFQTPVTPPLPFTNQYVLGNYAYGTDESLDNATSVVEGDVYATPNPNKPTSGSLGPGSNSATPYAQDASYSHNFTYSYAGTTINNYYCPSAADCYLLQPNQLLEGSYTVNSNGTGTFGSEVVSVTNGNVIFMIDESPLNAHPTVTVVEQ